MYIKYIMKEIQQLVQCSALKSSLKTAKRPQKDQTRLEKDRTTGLGFLVLRFMDQKKTSLLIFQPYKYASKCAQEHINWSKIDEDIIKTAKHC